MADISACIPLTIPTLHFSCGLVTAKGCIRYGSFYNQYRNPPQNRLCRCSLKTGTKPIRGFSGYSTHSDSGKVARIHGISHRAVLACPLFGGGVCGACPTPLTARGTPCVRRGLWGLPPCACPCGCVCGLSKRKGRGRSAPALLAVSCAVSPVWRSVRGGSAPPLLLSPVSA